MTQKIEIPKDIDAFVAECRTKCDAATDGPWQVGPWRGGDSDPMVQRVIGIRDDGNPEVDVICRHMSSHVNRNTNAAFIAHSRTALPEALAVIERLAKERDRLQVTVSHTKELIKKIDDTVRPYLNQHSFAADVYGISACIHRLESEDCDE